MKFTEGQKDAAVNLRKFVEQEGIEPGDMMDDPRWEDLNERAVAAELNAWALFVEMTGQQG